MKQDHEVSPKTAELGANGSQLTQHSPCCPGCLLFPWMVLYAGVGKRQSMAPGGAEDMGWKRMYTGLEN